MKTAITPTREEDYTEWYQEVLKAAELAQHSAVRGCMVILPWGYAIWEEMQRLLDARFKETGHQNAYFPLFIPLSYLEKEAEHVEGFAKECAVVTHHRLEKNSEGKLVPAGELEEPLIVRPTSEMIIGEMFSKWITSYRDLPLLINQWANVVRWEMRTRLFLRTTEFLWQEGHTAHATREEALEETMRMLQIYVDFVQDKMALPVIAGEKPEHEKFPGAVSTFTIEAMMQDRKALQGGTSHFLGQNFARSCGIKYRSAAGSEELAWTTSWGVTTRLIGALVMTHSDDDGLILPPKVASKHVAIIPIVHKEETRKEVMEYCEALAKDLRSVHFDGSPLRVVLDTRDMRGGDKTWSWIKKGVPLRIEIGPRDVAASSFSVMRRDRAHKEGISFTRSEFLAKVSDLLEEVQTSLFAKALAFQKKQTRRIDTKEEFYAFFTPQNQEKPEIHGGFALAHFCGRVEIADKLKEELGVTVRCLPLEGAREAGSCIFTGERSERLALFAKAY